MTTEAGPALALWVLMAWDDAEYEQRLLAVKQMHEHQLLSEQSWREIEERLSDKRGPTP